MEAMGLLESYRAVCLRGIDWILPEWYLVDKHVDLCLTAAAYALVILAAAKLSMLGGPIGRRRRAVIAAAYRIILYRRSPLALALAECRLIRQSCLLILVTAPLLLLGAGAFYSIKDALQSRYGYAPAGVGEGIVIHGQLPVEWPGEDGTAKFLAGAQDAGMRIEARVSSPVTRQAWAKLAGDRPGIYRLSADSKAGDGPAVNVARSAWPARAVQYAGGLRYQVCYRPLKWFGRRNGWIWCFLGAAAALCWPLAKLIRLRM